MTYLIVYAESRVAKALAVETSRCGQCGQQFAKKSARVRQ